MGIPQAKLKRTKIGWGLRAHACGPGLILAGPSPAQPDGQAMRSSSIILAFSLLHPVKLVFGIVGQGRLVGRASA